LFDKSTKTIPSSAAGVTHVAVDEDTTEAWVTLLPNLHCMPDRKLTPITVTTVPPERVPMLGTRAVAASAAVYSKEAVTDRSAPLTNTSRFTTAGAAAVGDTQTTTFSEINAADPETIAPNLQRIAKEFTKALPNIDTEEPPTTGPRDGTNDINTALGE